MMITLKRIDPDLLFGIRFVKLWIILSKQTSKTSMALLEVYGVV